MEDKTTAYLFTSTQKSLTSNVISKVSIPEDLHKKNIQTLDHQDSYLLSHNTGILPSCENSQVSVSTSLKKSTSTFSIASTSSSSGLSFSLLDHESDPIDQNAIRCVNESNWGSYALDVNLWDDDRAPVVKMRNVKEMLFEDLEFCGVFTDRLIGAGKSYLTKSPESNLYVLSKCIMRNMYLTNITMLYYHHYLQYIDLAYNYISNLLPLEGIPYLTYINVSHNRLKTILNFSPPWYLTYVNLSYNYIPQMRDISEFWSIVYLDLSHNAIETISGLQTLKYLKYLNLSYNLIECIENLDKLNIQELNLEGNCILSYKPAIPGYGINALPELRTLYLGYNKLSTLDFFKNAYSLRVIDLKFNRISDLMELSNFKGLIQEIDLRGNGCTKWPNYRSVLLYSLPSIRIIDGNDISISEKVAAETLFAPPINLRAACTITKLTVLEQLSIPKIDSYVAPYDEVGPPLVILTGPSTVKKFGLAIHIAQTLSKKVKYCRWYTTKTFNDFEAKSYIIINRDQFNEISRRGEFLAIQEKLGNSYGLHREEIGSLMLENKIGIAQMDLHGSIQMTKRYPNSKPVLVLTKSEEIHREWIQEGFEVFTCSKENDAQPEETALQLIKQILNDIMENLALSRSDSFVQQQGDEIINATLESETFFNVLDISKFPQDSFRHNESNEYLGIEPATLENIKELRVILDEFSHIMVEDQHFKRKRHQAKVLQRRNTLLKEPDSPSAEETSESDYSEEILIERTPETKKPEDVKEFYTDLILKSRRIYYDQHLNKPGFFSFVVFTDDYNNAFNRVINFIYELYTKHSTDEPKYSTELNHVVNVATPTMVNTIADEIKESLSSSVLQRKKLLRMDSVTSWKELMPSQMTEDPIHFKD